MPHTPAKIILILLLSFLLTGCTAEAAPSQPSSEAAPSSEAQQSAFVPAVPGRLSIAVSPDLAPMEFVIPAEDDENTLLLAGFDISLGEYLADAMELEVQWLPMEFEDCLHAVEDGAADMAISSIAWTAARQERFSLSNPYIPYKGTADVVVMQSGAEALTQIVNTVLEQAEQAGCYTQWYSQAKTDALSGVEVTFGSSGPVLK